MNNTNEQTVDIKPLFESFQWHREAVNDANVSGGTYAELAGLAKDIACGCSTIIELIEFDYLQSTSGGKPMMNASEHSNLSRLAMRSLNMLEKIADEGMDWVYDHRTQEGIAERNKR